MSFSLLLLWGPFHCTMVFPRSSRNISPLLKLFHDNSTCTWRDGGIPVELTFTQIKIYYHAVVTFDPQYLTPAKPQLSYTSFDSYDNKHIIIYLRGSANILCSPAVSGTVMAPVGGTWLAALILNRALYALLSIPRSRWRSSSLWHAASAGRCRRLCQRGQNPRPPRPSCSWRRSKKQSSSAIKHGCPGGGVSANAATSIFVEFERTYKCGVKTQ